VRKGVPF